MFKKKKERRKTRKQLDANSNIWNFLYRVTWPHRASGYKCTLHFRSRCIQYASFSFSSVNTAGWLVKDTGSCTGGGGTGPPGLMSSPNQAHEPLFVCCVFSRWVVRLTDEVFVGEEARGVTASSACTRQSPVCCTCYWCAVDVFPVRACHAPVEPAPATHLLLTVAIKTQT